VFPFRLVKPKKSSSATTDRQIKSNSEAALYNSSGDQHLSINTFHDNHQRSVCSGSSHITMTRSVSAATRHLQDDDQLAVKGRYLLGKYYNGPTQWLAPGSKAKGKQALKK
jgi:hypothetical protein